jgi:DNA-binding transcriptional LysR family regulator
MWVNIDFDKLKGFVAVGEELHFTRAAENRLHVSQPWLSRSVRSLEQKLGVQLFERHSRHVELTAPGRRMLYGARKLIHEFDRTVSAVVQERRDDGQLTVGYSSYVDLHFIAALREIPSGSHPIRLNLEGSSSEEASLRVRNHDWDSGIVTLPVDTSNLDIIPLFGFPLAAAMPKTHRLAKKRNLQLKDLQGEPLVLDKSRESPFREWLSARLAEVGITRTVVQDAPSPHEAQYLVTRGVGIALANSGAFRVPLAGIVVRSFPSLVVETAMVVRKENRSPLLEAFGQRVLQLAKTRIAGRLALQPAA